MLLEIVELFQGILHGIGQAIGIAPRHRKKTVPKSRYLFLFFCDNIDW